MFSSNGMKKIEQLYPMPDLLDYYNCALRFGDVVVGEKFLADGKEWIRVHDRVLECGVLINCTSPPPYTDDNPKTLEVYQWFDYVRVHV